MKEYDQQPLEELTPEMLREYFLSTNPQDPLNQQHIPQFPQLTPHVPHHPQNLNNLHPPPPLPIYDHLLQTSVQYPEELIPNTNNIIRDPRKVIHRESLPQIPLENIKTDPLLCDSSSLNQILTNSESTDQTQHISESSVTGMKGMVCDTANLQPLSEPLAQLLAPITAPAYHSVTYLDDLGNLPSQGNVMNTPQSDDEEITDSFDWDKLL